MGLDDEPAHDPGRGREVEAVFDPPLFGTGDRRPGDSVGRPKAEAEGHEAARLVLHVVRELGLLHAVVEDARQAGIVSVPDRVEALSGDFALLPFELLVLHHPADGLGEPLRLEDHEVLEVDAVGEMGDDAQLAHQGGHVVEAVRLDVRIGKDVVELLARDVGEVLAVLAGLLSYHLLGLSVGSWPGRAHQLRVGGEALEVAGQGVDVLSRRAAHGKEAIVGLEEVRIVSSQAVHRDVWGAVLTVSGHEDDAGAGSPGEDRVEPVFHPVDAELLAALEDQEV
jgi:hypothetical protein